MGNKHLTITGMILFAMELALTPGFAQAQQVVTPEYAPLDIMLSGSVGLSQYTQELPSFISMARQQDFLSSRGVSLDSPLAPCALISAVTTSSVMNMLFAGISRPASIKIIPPHSTCIFGKYDAEIKRRRVLWDEFFSNCDWPIASAVAIVMLFVLVITILLLRKVQAVEEGEH